MSKAGYNFS